MTIISIVFKYLYLNMNLLEVEANIMKRLVGISIVFIVAIILASLSNVVGYQTVQSTNQNKINKEVDQRDFLFQTIVDIVNNKEIQRIILKSQISDGIFPVSDNPVITKNKLKQMYFIGLTLSKSLNKSSMHSIIGKYQFNNQEMQKEISAVIEKDATLHREVSQLSNSKCDCDNEKTSFWDIPVYCSILYGLIQITDKFFGFFAGLAVWAFYHFLKGFVLVLSAIYYIGYSIELSLFYLGVILNCWSDNLLNCRFIKK